MEVIAEQRLVVRYPDGEGVPVCLRVGRPGRNRHGDHVCPVQAAGLRLWEGPSEIAGEGSLQALTLGLSFVRQMLSAEVERGAVLHFDDDEERVSLDVLFGSPGIG